MPSGGGGGNKRLAQQQAQVDEVVDIMRQNVDKVLERDKNLSMLDDRAGSLTKAVDHVESNRMFLFSFLLR